MYRHIVFRRRMLELSSRRSVRRIPNGIINQEPMLLFFQKQYSVGPERNSPQGSTSAGNPPNSGSYFPKLVVAGAALSAVVFGVYQLNQKPIEDGNNFPESAKIREAKSIKHQSTTPSIHESTLSSLKVDGLEKNIEPHSLLVELDNINENGGESQESTISSIQDSTISSLKVDGPENLEPHSLLVELDNINENGGESQESTISNLKVDGAEKNLEPHSLVADQDNINETGGESQESTISSIQDSTTSSLKVDGAEKNLEPYSLLDEPDNINENGGKSTFQVNVKDQMEPEESSERAKDGELPSNSQDNLISQNAVSLSDTASDESLNMKGQEGKNILEKNETSDTTLILSHDSAIQEEKVVKSIPTEEQDVGSLGEDKPSVLLDAYHLRDGDEVPISTQLNTYKDLLGGNEDSGDIYVSKDGKLVLDFLEAIHAAEKRQEELDTHIFAEQKRKMKDKYEKELKDTRARELMYAEEAAILDKELRKERLKTASALKSLEEELNDKLKMKLEQKEAEAESNLKRVQELAKAELAAALASEKSSQLEKMEEANLNINALCMAFYARSEEARQSHSLHKLALGALALEDALSKGLPILNEIEALHTYLKDMNKEPLLDLVLSSLPSETQNCGTDTLLQLRHKFETLKGTLRHYSLIPPAGGGIITHSLAHIASSLKVKEVGDGIESVINKVERFLEEGKLPEAADALENGVEGIQVEDIKDWVKRARNRAITEQALTLLQAYAASISLT
ncbi:MICOS complex subunit MIC60-like isoform X2 [Impatiens glandulifera]|uniref:MICOS complex subunit MIC60-like isoform X2 n=1 Tax=Impatiens glandulifera TaxID=253017 RepID=UPI001FB123EF|nr:MICOS complex subunit MIC60-like isoform X2 [Impatiens glandulifera]